MRITENDTRNDEGRRMITDILEIMRSGQVGNGVGFKRVDMKVLAELTKKVNRVVSEIQTTNIADTNQLDLKIGGCEGKGSKEPGWKRIIKGPILELWRHVNILETSKQWKLKKEGKTHEVGEEEEHETERRKGCIRRT